MKTKQKTLTWVTIRKVGSSDGAGRWYPVSEIAEYFAHLRSPSRAWPNSYAKAAQTAKFAKWLLVNNNELALKLDLGV